MVHQSMTRYVVLSQCIDKWDNHIEVSTFLKICYDTDWKSLTEALPITIHNIFFMPPTSKKLEGHIASGLFVRPYVHLFVTLFDA